MTNGEIIRAAREGKKLSLRACAHELGISATYLHHIETGKQRLPESRAARFVEVLAISSSVLTFDSDRAYTRQDVIDAFKAGAANGGDSSPVDSDYDEIQTFIDLCARSFVDKLDARKGHV